MAKRKLTDSIVRDLPTPDSGMTVVRDGKVKGLGVRVLPSGTRAFILDYSSAGRRRIYTIGKFPEWKTIAARAHATELKHRIRYEGFDPAAELKAGRDAPTMADLSKQFEEEHLPKLRTSTRVGYERMLRKEILPQLGARKVADIQFEDVARLHRAITSRGSPAVANFCVAVCSKFFNFAIHLRIITSNPVKGVEHNREQPRSRYLSRTEITGLSKALTQYADQDIADIFRLLLFTGARRGEMLSARWEQFDLGEGTWVKPSHATKQNREHRVPLAAPARALLVQRRKKADAELQRLKKKIVKAHPAERLALQERLRRIEIFLFPARDGKTGHITEVKKAWASICKAAGIVTREELVDENTGQKRVIERHSARIHDLRHTAASVLASSGASLPLIGQLLGHTQAATTQRYSHLFDDAQRAAVERLGAIVGSGPSAKVVQFKRRQRR